MKLWDDTSELLDKNRQNRSSRSSSSSISSSGRSFLECPAELQYEDLLEHGSPPSRPLEFPTPTVHRCELVNITALDHRTGRIHDVKNVIMKTNGGDNRSSSGCNNNNNNNNKINTEIFPRRAYLIQKTLSKSTYGIVKLCVVLVRRNMQLKHYEDAAVPFLLLQQQQQKQLQQQQQQQQQQQYHQHQHQHQHQRQHQNQRKHHQQHQQHQQHQLQQQQSNNNHLVQWESTEELVVLKASSWTKMDKLRGRHLEDPIHEIAAMQHIGNYNAHVLGCIDVLQDENWLYTITPYCSGGDLYGRVSSSSSSSSFAATQETGEANEGGGRRGEENDYIKTRDESKVRRWFKQLLLGLYHLQQKGVCHRDICLENIMLDNNDNVVLADFGLSLRIPYSDPHNLGCPHQTTDVSEGRPYRRLIKPQGQSGGNLYCMAPEILEGKGPFDGPAIDLWSLSIVLFVLLVGSQPFEWADVTDQQFEMISHQGRLHDVIVNVFQIRSLSSEVCDLLQNMLWYDPRRRLTLSDVIRHPWVTMEDGNKNINNNNNEKNKKNGIHDHNENKVRGKSQIGKCNNNNRMNESNNKMKSDGKAQILEWATYSLNHPTKNIFRTIQKTGTRTKKKSTEPLRVWQLE